MSFFQERLRSDHDLTKFDSGNRRLDEWLVNHALHADRSGTGRTYVWVADGAVVAYFTLAPHLIRKDETPKVIGRGSPDSIPAVLIARLALDRSLHGSSHGGLLLVEAIRTALEAIRQAGGRVIVVDAIDNDAAAFYRHHGFKPIPGNPFRLVMKVWDARSLFERQ